MFFQLFFFATVLLFAAKAEAQANKGINQFFANSGSYKTLQLDLLSGDVKIKTTPGTRISVEMTVTLSNPNEKLLDMLAEKGRYELVQTEDTTANLLQIVHKQPSSKVILRGEECVETYRYTIYVPETFKVVMLNGTTAKGISFVASK